MKVNKPQIVFIFIFIISISYIGYYFYSNYTDRKAHEEIVNIFYKTIEGASFTSEEQHPADEEILDRVSQLEKLKKENPDIVAWIEIPGTNINHPVLQTTNNSYYLTRNHKKKFSQNGSIFLDKDANLKKPSTNFLIYGHRTTNGQMFDDLGYYIEKDFYKKHSTINFTTLKEDAKYEIIAVFFSRVYYKNEKNVFRYYYFIDAKKEKDFDYYVNNSKKASLYATGKTAVYGDQLLTLSTCDYSQKDGRLVVVAKKL